MFCLLMSAPLFTSSSTIFVLPVPQAMIKGVIQNEVSCKYNNNNIIIDVAVRVTPTITSLFNHRSLKLVILIIATYLSQFIHICTIINQHFSNSSTRCHVKCCASTL